MNRLEMHTAFRVFGQQMGMQKIRTILPEEIDYFINAAIDEKVREVIASNTITQFNDKVSIQQNAISPINYIRTLYVEKLMENNVDSPVTLDTEDVMYYLSFSISTSGTRYHKCRLIEPNELEATLDDYCSSASLDYPIITLYKDEIGDYVADVYTDKERSATLAFNLKIKYIKNPSKLSEDNPTGCDLPEYTHNEIVQLAVQKYFISVGSTTNNVN